jgi:alkylhydroperoxidase family enzyme
LDEDEDAKTATEFLAKHKSDDPFERALTYFAKNFVRQRGLVLDQDLDMARKAGIDDGLMLEIIANVALHTLTNYANRLADTEIDSPVVEVSLQGRN